MKKAIGIFKIFTLAATVLCLSCTKSSNTIPNKNAIAEVKLKAPNGFVIAKNIGNLESRMKSTINRKFQAADLEFKITNINYASTKSGGTIADVNYITSENIESNMIMMFDVKEKVIVHGPLTGIIEDKYTSLYSSHKYNEGRKYSCSGPSCCKVHVLEHPDGSIDIDCSCVGCTMTIE